MKGNHEPLSCAPSHSHLSAVCLKALYLVKMFIKTLLRAVMQLYWSSANIISDHLPLEVLHKVPVLLLVSLQEGVARAPVKGRQTR